MIKINLNGLNYQLQIPKTSLNSTIGFSKENEKNSWQSSSVNIVDNHAQK